MADLKISLTCADYVRVLPLACGMIDTPGIDLTMILGRYGRWTDRAEALRRATGDATVTGGEGSMAQHLYRIDKGDRSHVGLPVFPLRNFGGRDFYVRKGSPIRSLKDLAGKRVGTYSVTASGSIWYRHFMRWGGLDPASIDWLVGNIDDGAIELDVALALGGIAHGEARIEAIALPHQRRQPRQQHQVLGGADGSLAAAEQADAGIGHRDDAE